MGNLKNFGIFGSLFSNNVSEINETTNESLDDQQSMELSHCRCGDCHCDCVCDANYCDYCDCDCQCHCECENDEKDESLISTLTLL